METLQNYRVTMIFDTRGQNTAESLIEKTKELLISLNAKVADVKDLGSKAFVRVTDRRMPSAHYVQYNIEAPATLPVAFREKLRLDHSIKRILIQSK